MQLIERPAYPLRRTMPAVWARVHLLQTDLSERDFRRVPEFGCISDFAPPGRVVCQVNGTYVSRRDWWRPVQAGDILVFAEVPQGGDSDPLRTVLTIALLIAAPELGALLTGEFGVFYGVSEALVTAGLILGGQVLINALLPTPQLPGFNAGQSPSPTYNVGFQGNQARLGQSIPQRFGQERYFPDFASQPYNFFQDDDQYYCAVLNCGTGEHNILQVSLDDSDIRNFQDVTFAIVGPGQTSRASDFDTYETLADQTIAADNIVTAQEVTGQQLITTEWLGAFCPVRAGLKLDTLFVDLVFPGLGVVDDDGSIDARSISWQVGVRLINDAGTALEPWRVIATETLTRNTTETVRVSYAYTSLPTEVSIGGFINLSVTVPPAISVGRYEVRLRRVSARSDNRLVLNDMYWAGLRARLSVPGIKRDDCTYVVIKARASDQLSGLSQRRFAVLGQRLIERYDSDTETWHTAPLTVADNFSRNPAEIARFIMRARGLPDSRIDHVTLDELRDLYDERQDHFDFSFDTRVSVNDALTLVGRAGRARPLLRRGAVYTMVRDELQTLPVAMFVPRNMDQDSFAIDVALATEETPDAVLFRYRDGQVNDERLVYGQVYNGTVYAYPAGFDDTSGFYVPQRPAGVPAPTRVQEERLEGITGRSHALREAAYFMAQAFYRRMFPSWTTNLEALLPAYGSLVGIAHDTAEWGQSGDVVDWDAGSLTLTTSEPLTWTEGGSHYVRLQTTTAGVSAAILVTPGGSANEMVLDEAPAEAPVFDRADRERTRYLFGELADVSRYVRVLAIRPQGQTSIRMEAVIDDERVHTADNPWLPVGDEIQDPLPDGTYVDEEEPSVFTETFDEGLTPYTVINDTASTFEIVTTDSGNTLQINSVSAGSDQRISRSIAAFTCSEVRARFRLTDLTGNDGGYLVLKSGGVYQMTFNPRRQASFDGRQRPRFSVIGQTVSVGAAALEQDVWYALYILFVPGAGNTTCSIYRESDGALVAQAGLSISLGSVPCDALEFFADNGSATTATQWDDITLN